MSLRGAIAAMRDEVPLTAASANRREPLEAPLIKAVPSVPRVPPEKAEPEPEARSGIRQGSLSGKMGAFLSGREPGNAMSAHSVRRAVVRFKLVGDQGGGSLLGDFGDSEADLVAELRRRYGARLDCLELTKVDENPRICL